MLSGGGPRCGERSAGSYAAPVTTPRIGCARSLYRESFAFIRTLAPETLDVLEISGGNQWTRDLTFKSYTNTTIRVSTSAARRCRGSSIL